jgi:hypothetical protein
VDVAKRRISDRPLILVVTVGLLFRNANQNLFPHELIDRTNDFIDAILRDDDPFQNCVSESKNGGKTPGSNEAPQVPSWNPPAPN